MGGIGIEIKGRAFGVERKQFERLLSALLMVVLPVALVFAGALDQPESALQVVAVKLEPVRQGKNVVRVSVRNVAAASQPFMIGIQANSPDYGGGVGWGTQFRETIGSLETRELRFVYKIYGPVTDRTKLSLTFYNPASSGDVDPKSFFLRRQYLGLDLERAGPAAGHPPPAHAVEAGEAIAALRRFQDALGAKRYREAWESVTSDFRAVHFCRTEADFIKNIVAEDSRMKPFLWPMGLLLGFRPASTAAGEDGRLLLGGSSGQGLAVFLAREEDRWKVDEIAGYTPQAVLWGNWQERLLPTLKTRRSEHFEIFFAPGSTAEKEVERVAAERDRGFRAIADFLGLRPEIRIRLVFFEDMRTKAWETGHRGAGWAFDHTIVEVFNAQERLDPFHEVCHILANGLGDPPALFNEGLAVYMSERLGAPALKNLGGGTLSIDERVRQLMSRNEGIPLTRLFEFTEIGSDESKPAIAYAEAASFVKFLIEEFPHDKFLAAYSSLKNSADPAVREKNLGILRDIYGGTLAGHAQAWEKKILSGGFSPLSVERRPGNGRCDMPME